MACVAALGAGCTSSNVGDLSDSSTSLYALVQGIDGVYFYPPLGPEPTPAGTFEGDLLDGITVTIEAEAADGAVDTLATFSQSTTPAVALLTDRERYFVNIPAATYVTDPSKTYRIRMLLDGSELGSSVLSSHIFAVLQWNPALPIGVMVRVEGTGAVRNIARRTRHGGGAPAHCADGRRNKDETGVDCGGSHCAPCPEEICDGVDNNRDGNVDEGNPGGGQPCTTGLAGICSPGTTECTGGHIVCQQNAQPTAETCNGADDNCNGSTDDGASATCPSRANASSYCSGGACGFSCNAGYGNCNNSAPDGCEINLMTDRNNCGSCGNTCGTGFNCVLGACTCQCAGGMSGSYSGTDSGSVSGTMNSSCSVVGGFAMTGRFGTQSGALSIDGAGHVSGPCGVSGTFSVTSCSMSGSWGCYGWSGGWSLHR